VKTQNTLAFFGYGTAYEFESDAWDWSVGGVQKQQEGNRHLNRLEVMKELFNVFINRAVGLCLISRCDWVLIFRTCLHSVLSILPCLWSLDS
jgi:hypothetical protein